MNLTLCRKVRDLLSLLLASCKDKNIEPDISIYDERDSVKIVIILKKD